MLFHLCTVTAILISSDTARSAIPYGDAGQFQQGCTYTYKCTHMYLLNATACMLACMGKLNLFEVTASTIIRQTTYVVCALRCARAETMRTSKQLSREFTSGQQSIVLKCQVSIKHINMLQASALYLN